MVITRGMCRFPWLPRQSNQIHLRWKLCLGLEYAFIVITPFSFAFIINVFVSEVVACAFETDVFDLGWLTTRGIYFYPMLLSSSMASLSIQSDSSSMKALSRYKQRKTCTSPRNENTTRKSNSLMIEILFLLLSWLCWRMVLIKPRKLRACICKHTAGCQRDRRSWLRMVDNTRNVLLSDVAVVFHGFLVNPVRFIFDESFV